MQEQKIDISKLEQNWAKGDAQTLAGLYDLLADQVYRYVYFKIHADEAEDLVELVFLKAWEKRHTFDAKKSSLKTWLFVIARNVVIDFMRAKRDVVDLDAAINIPDASQPTPKDVTERRLNRDNLRLALNYLEEPYKEIVVLRYMEDFSYGEIADLLGKTETSVRVLTFRALKKLKQTLLDLDMTL